MLRHGVKLAKVRSPDPWRFFLIPRQRQRALSLRWQRHRLAAGVPILDTRAIC